jgi:hypothetical protein
MKISGDKLFDYGEYQNLNACVGKNGGPYDFSSYGEGFFYAAFHNIDAIMDDKWTLDILVYPICFNFRHGIELYIKHFVVLSARLLDESASAFKTTHHLIDNWNLFSSFAERFPAGTISREDFLFVDNHIKNFISIDPSGQTFRYPEDLNKHLHLTGISVINVAVLYQKMKKIHDIFETWDCCLKEILEYQQKSELSVNLPRI